MRIITILLACVPSVLFCQSFNMTLMANYDIEPLPERFGANYNDVWGYKSPGGTEVAIVGGVEDIFFIDVTDPWNPSIIYTHSVLNSNGTQNLSLWRDFKTYQHYAYACADEGTSGLLIFDLSQVPATVTLDTQITSFWNRAHNIYIDEMHGRLYGAGTNTQSNGIKIIDIADPDVPVQLASIALNTVGGGYVHDVHVRDNIAYCSHGSLSKLQMYDFSNLPSFSVVGVVEGYPDPGYNHSSWLNAAGDYLVMCDETHGSDVKLVDVSDPLEISADDFSTFYSELLGESAPDASVPHNPFILGDLAMIAYYHDGVQIYDISDPGDITRIAYYDTYPENTGYQGYEGCWGVYPFLPSGIILASDQTHGLYVMEIADGTLDIDFVSFQAVRKNVGAYLQWMIMDASYGNTFEVKRSEDGGKTFETVGVVRLNENQIQYHFTDPQLDQHKKYHYRIDFVQLDGIRLSSPVRRVNTGIKDRFIQVVNPVQDALMVQILQPVESMELRLFNEEGKIIKTYSLAQADGRVELEAGDLMPGHYILTANWPGGNESNLIQVVK